MNVYLCKRVFHSTTAHGQRAHISAVAYSVTMDKPYPWPKNNTVEGHRETWTDKEKEAGEMEGKGKKGHKVKK